MRSTFYCKIDRVLCNSHMDLLWKSMRERKSLNVCKTSREKVVRNRALSPFHRLMFSGIYCSRPILQKGSLKGEESEKESSFISHLPLTKLRNNSLTDMQYSPCCQESDSFSFTLGQQMEMLLVYKQNSKNNVSLKFKGAMTQASFWQTWPWTPDAWQSISYGQIRNYGNSGFKKNI